MTLESIYYIGQTVAVIVLLASVIFVGLQIRQNTKATRAASAYEVNKSWGVFNSELFHEDDQVILSTLRLFDKTAKLSDLSEIELARGQLFIRSIIQRNMATWLLCEEGSLPRVYWEGPRLWLKSVIKLPVIRAIFEMEQGLGIVAQDFYDELLKGEDDDIDFAYLSPLHPGVSSTGETKK